MRELAHEEERWLSVQRERELHSKLWELRTRRLRLVLSNVPMTDAQRMAYDVVNELINEMADEYWRVLNYNRERGWS